MKIYWIKSLTPYETLAYENIIMNDPAITGDVLLIYQHSNAIIVGNNQNTREEINRQFVQEHNIQLARRLSGGGAVYHDLGNVCFSFITDYNKQSGYERFLTPILGFLQSLGLNAEFKGRNDILVNGAKISGNAQYVSGNRIVSHGTLLFNVNLSILASALNPSKIKYESKGIQSVRKRVTNIFDELPTKMDVHEFVQRLVNYFVANKHGELVEVPAEQYAAKLAELRAKFSSEEWIYNKAANFTFSNANKFDGGILKINGNIEQGIIKELVFEGDFLSKQNVREIEPLFAGVKLNESAILKVLDSIKFEEYFGTITKQEILTLLLG
ncbi:lipoate--protein ligase [Mycoplasmopsis columbinasalis]|uniref:lipoate--protein ligase n=1 Tax=Mycoplasmopsis columbinasalis TaxID=114880 RepID=A0A449BAD9_9BACT|nr:lipoate--protein ligase [Mycoplasmopsis columbinasalis]VEU78148.1 Lipoate-protein ligase A [Mycoplasmopsis columbinasalis]